MSLSKLNENLNIISSLPDKPTQNAAELKGKWDEAGNLIKKYINNTLIPQIEAGQTTLENSFNGGTNKALTAEMGKKLNNEKQNVIGYGTTVPTLAQGQIYIQIF